MPWSTRLIELKLKLESAENRYVLFPYFFPMHSHLSLFNRPQISTMPRPKTPAAAYLNAYKLTIEKQRLEQELASLTLRQQKIQKQLAFIDSQVAEIEQGVHQARSLPPAMPSIDQALTQAPSPARAVAAATGVGPESQEFATMVLEY
jgi:hypothetical protein